MCSTYREIWIYSAILHKPLSPTATPPSGGRGNKIGQFKLEDPLIKTLSFFFLYGVLTK
jgi:hypothetical protein